MSDQIDYKKEWERTKKQLVVFSKEMAELAKKGEKEFVKFSKRSKLHIDSTAIGLKKEHLYYQIGKEYVVSNTPAEPTPKLKKLIDEVRKSDKQQKELKTKLSVENNKKSIKDKSAEGEK